jgi:hypothetical protein
VYNFRVGHFLSFIITSMWWFLDLLSKVFGT